MPTGIISEILVSLDITHLVYFTVTLVPLLSQVVHTSLFVVMWFGHFDLKSLLR